MEQLCHCLFRGRLLFQSMVHSCVVSHCFEETFQPTSPLNSLMLRSQELDASKLLKRAWRDDYQKTSNDSKMQVIASACLSAVSWIPLSTIPSQEISPPSFAAAIDQMASCVKKTSWSLVSVGLLRKAVVLFCVEVIWKWLPVQFCTRRKKSDTRRKNLIHRWKNLIHGRLKVWYTKEQIWYTEDLQSDTGGKIWRTEEKKPDIRMKTFDTRRKNCDTRRKKSDTGRKNLIHWGKTLIHGRKNLIHGGKIWYTEEKSDTRRKIEYTKEKNLIHGEKIMWYTVEKSDTLREKSDTRRKNCDTRKKKSDTRRKNCDTRRKNLIHRWKNSDTRNKNPIHEGTNLIQEDKIWYIDMEEKANTRGRSLIQEKNLIHGGFKIWYTEEKYCDTRRKNLIQGGNTLTHGRKIRYTKGKIWYTEEKLWYTEGKIWYTEETIWCTEENIRYAEEKSDARRKNVSRWQVKCFKDSCQSYEFQPYIKPAVFFTFDHMLASFWWAPHFPNHHHSNFVHLIVSEIVDQQLTPHGASLLWYPIAFRELLPRDLV